MRRACIVVFVLLLTLLFAELPARNSRHGRRRRSELLPVQQNAFDRLDFLLERLHCGLKHLLVGFLGLLLFINLVSHSNQLPVDGLCGFGELINLIALFAAEKQRFDEFLIGDKKKNHARRCKGQK